MHLIMSWSLFITTIPAVPRPVLFSTQASKSILIVSQIFLGNKGIEDPPGITAFKLSHPPTTPLLSFPPSNFERFN